MCYIESKLELLVLHTTLLLLDLSIDGNSPWFSGRPVDILRYRVPFKFSTVISLAGLVNTFGALTIIVKAQDIFLQHHRLTWFHL